MGDDCPLGTRIPQLCARIISGVFQRGSYHASRIRSECLAGLYRTEGLSEGAKLILEEQFRTFSGFLKNFHPRQARRSLGFRLAGEGQRCAARRSVFPRFAAAAAPTAGAAADDADSADWASVPS